MSAFTLTPLNATKLDGYLGDKLALCLERRIKAEDVDGLVEPFRHREERNLWHTEFWGKWMLAAVPAYEYSGDKALYEQIRSSSLAMMATQSADGYIGNYPDDGRLKGWDIWGRKYTLLGLMGYYDLSKDPQALQAACRLADLCIKELGPGAEVNIAKTGMHHGMASCSILEPIVRLYRRTREERYLEMARHIIACIEGPDGPQLIKKGLAGVPVGERFPLPEKWWSWYNGQKSYEMMSCYQGMLEMYEELGEERLLRACDLVAKDIIATEINIAGSGASCECWYYGKKWQTEPAMHMQETCVTVTWMKFCQTLLRLTGDVTYAEELEKTTYNAFLASLNPDVSSFSKYCPLEGIRGAGVGQCGMTINCCIANGPRGFFMLPEAAVMSNAGELAVNLYEDLQAQATLKDGLDVALAISGNYPVNNRVQIAVTPSAKATWSLLLRIPAWSAVTSVTINGAALDGVNAGSYCRIERAWQVGDVVELVFDFSCRVAELNRCLALQRGPLVLARDARFNDGDIDAAVLVPGDQRLELATTADAATAAGVWQAFTTKLVNDLNAEGPAGGPQQIHFCDYASAGNTWTAASRYRVWLRKGLRVTIGEHLR
ncbi:MAG TPA: glycoside hydrolase family 127 protein [Lentisphaeria bacterium]|nr:glycoside hydrolase family 127 protein [Lentisphaeria bacterium]